MTMVGRSAELNRLTDLLDEAESGHGCFALVTGEAGIGKSRLVTEWAALGRHRGFVVLTGRAIEGGGSLRPVAHALMEAVRDSEVLESASLRPFRAALSRVLPGIAADEAVASTVDPTVVLGEGVLRLLRSLAGSGTLLVLEDLHWADPDTVALLNYLGGALKTSRVVVAATVREDSPGAAVVGGLVRIPDAIHLRLGTLNYADADLLVEQRHPGLHEAQRMLVIKRAEGVPLVIEELLAGTTVSAGSVAAAVPDSFAEVVLARLHGLRQEHRQVLIAAALVGGDPDWSLAAVISDLGDASALAAARATTDVPLPDLLGELSVAEGVGAVRFMT